MLPYKYYEYKRRLYFSLDIKKGYSFVENRLPYAHSKIITAQEGADYIKEKILSGEPFTASRFGSTEMLPVINRLRGVKSEKLCSEADFHICQESGFFPNDKFEIDKYKDLFLNTVGSIDMLGIWLLIVNEEYIIEKYMNRPVVGNPQALNPIGENIINPWSEALEGKKVLVIHPFEDSIQEQYKKRELLFEDKRILPEFELKTIKAVQTLAGTKDDRFDNWFEALDWMKSEIDKVDFDIALLACGAYGIPLQDYIKKKGKQSVYVGGVLQLLFGIRGRRWDEDPLFTKFYNEHWIHPLDSETIKNKEKVEFGSPYW